MITLMTIIMEFISLFEILFETTRINSITMTDRKLENVLAYLWVTKTEVNFMSILFQLENYEHNSFKIYGLDKNYKQFL